MYTMKRIPKSVDTEKMIGRSGCCIARYSGGGGGTISYGVSKVERIMLKVRPIAPKPIAAGSGSSCSTVEKSDGYGGSRRRKRKYVRVKNKQTKKDASTTDSKKMKVSVPSSSSVSGGGDEVVTLSLMSETPDRREKSPERRSSQSEIPDLESPIALSFNKQRITVPDGHVQVASGHVVSVADHAVVMTSPPPPPQAVSFVTVECVTETWMNSGGPAATNMEMDTCPLFVTNGRDVVVWTNTAYREMTTAGGGSDETAAVVVVKKNNRVTTPVNLTAFTCKVKVTWGTESNSSPSTLTAPCDVWRLQSGGCAWRLDVKAALSLGR
ncbi:hypothetical protein L6452_39717 [Arctium lappa]|uniref:Uncharacterized protein n=1 Tax=Arctium lappa TaxID=4217 RepID=A0ACB8XU74_ARCLA|nr:hypothetical protein L6452_39717 [Arctium lappa]